MKNYQKNWNDIKGASWQYYHYELKGELRRQDKILLLLALGVFLLQAYFEKPY